MALCSIFNTLAVRSRVPWANEREKQGEEHRLTPLPTSYCAFTPTEAHTETEACVRESTLSKKHLQLKTALPQFYTQTVEAVAVSGVDAHESSRLL